MAPSAVTLEFFYLAPPLDILGFTRPGQSPTPIDKDSLARWRAASAALSAKASAEGISPAIEAELADLGSAICETAYGLVRDDLERDALLYLCPQGDPKAGWCMCEDIVWEAARKGDRFLVDRDIVVVRGYGDATLEPIDTAGKPIKVLFIGASPVGAGMTRLDLEGALGTVRQAWATWLLAPEERVVSGAGTCEQLERLAEWLDVNYGSALKQLLANGLGGVVLHVLDPKAMPFDDAVTTGAITCFRVGQRPTTLRVRSVKNTGRLGDLSAGRSVSWAKLTETRRWSTIVRPKRKPPRDYVELGEICRVHRGQVTGCNEVWIAGKHAEGLPSNVLVPAATKARDILDIGERLTSTDRLRRVIDLPVDLSQIRRHHRDVVQRFLRWAKSKGAHKSYVARHRKAWWAVGLREPAPILCTYMGRRPPTFVRNMCQARHINIAHGLYPRELLDDEVLDALVNWLRAHVRAEDGRTYAGGLTKFEPRELERVPIPPLEALVR